MVRMETGMPAISLAGHDRKKLYIIIGTGPEYVWLADGITRTMEKPKKKKKKHIQVIHRIPDVMKKALESGEPLRNEYIREAIESERRNWQEDKHVKSRCN